MKGGPKYNLVEKLIIDYLSSIGYRWPNYFKVPISNGIVEGLNNKAKVISHRAYGFLALYHFMGKLPRPESSFKFL